MAFCMNCGKQLPDGAKFCLECGTKLGDIKEDLTPKRETTYEGTVHKCPNCGDILDAYESICETCGLERRNIKAAVAVKEFEEKFLSAEVAEKKIDLIKTFAVPNTREDIQEFLVLAIANIGACTAFETELANAWITKYEQVYQKAELLWGRSPQLQDVQLKFLLARNTAKGAKRKEMLKAVLAIGFVLLICGGIIASVIGSTLAEAKEIAAENARLGSILEEINTCIVNESYNAARALATQLVFTYSGNFDQQYEDDIENWNKIRQEILELIAEAENHSDTP